MHIQQINDIEQQGLKKAYIKLVVTEKECMSQLEDEKLSLKTYCPLKKDVVSPLWSVSPSTYSWSFVTSCGIQGIA